MDPRFHGTVYRAANWSYLGLTQGYRRTRTGYSTTRLSPKKVFVTPLQANARKLLARPLLKSPYRQGVPKIMLSAQQMRSLPDFFLDIPVSAPCPRTTPSPLCGVGHCRRGHPVWHARLQSDGRLGAMSRPQCQSTVSLPLCQRSLSRAQRIDPAQCLNSCRSG